MVIKITFVFEIDISRNHQSKSQTWNLGIYQYLIIYPDLQKLDVTIERNGKNKIARKQEMEK
jgi:hypothetical protein